MSEFPSFLTDLGHAWDVHHQIAGHGHCQHPEPQVEGTLSSAAVH